MRDEGLTQAKIGERIGWSRSAVLNYVSVIDDVDTTVLDFAKDHQSGRVSGDDTVVSIHFTEGLFRNILSLHDHQQMSLVKKLVRGKDGKGHKYDKAAFKEEGGGHVAGMPYAGGDCRSGGGAERYCSRVGKWVC